MTDTIPNSLLVPKLLRIFAWSTVSLTMLFLVNKVKINMTLVSNMSEDDLELLIMRVPHANKKTKYIK